MMLLKKKIKVNLLLEEEATTDKSFTNDDQIADICFNKASHNTTKYLLLKWKVSRWNFCEKGGAFKDFSTILF